MPKAYLLAAGQGLRAGGPKAWLDWEGQPLLAKQLDFLKGRFQPADIAVSIQVPWLARCRELEPGAVWVPVAPEASPLYSLQSLLKASPLSDWGFLHHVDMPVWEPGLFELLMKSLPSPDACDAVAPRHGRRGGHPIVLSPRLADPLLALDPAVDRLDAWLASKRIQRVEVPYPCVLENLNWGVSPR